MTLGLDTSVVLRLLVGEPLSHARAAQARLKLAHARGEEIVVTDLVVAEAYFALQYHYGVPKERAREKLRAMLTSNVINLNPPEALWALDPTQGAGLVDRLVHARHQTLGATSLTFDRKMATLTGALRIALPAERAAKR